MEKHGPFAGALTDVRFDTTVFHRIFVPKKIGCRQRKDLLAMLLPDVPPVSPYGTLDGSLFLYKGNLAAFESSLPPSHSEVGDQTIFSKKKCIMLGGLSDGLLPTPYTQDLQTHCHELGWSLVQPILSSSYLGFGNGDLDRDCEELSALLWYLTCHREAEVFAIVGHSTGCQDAVHFLKHGVQEMIERTKVVVLQASVSDRESALMIKPNNYEDNIKLARDLVVQKKTPMEMMPRSAFWAPITAKRFLDLQDKGGADDFFSSDWTDEELIDRLGHIGQLSSSQQEDKGLNLLVAFSGSDEYVPKTIDTKRLAERLCEAMNHHSSAPVAELLYLPNANHNLSKGEGDKETFVRKVSELLKNVQ